VAHDVFISYSSKDKPVADTACALLEAKGIRCWIAPRDIQPGIDWGDSIVNAISGTRVMVLIFSSSANGSSQIKREVNQAIEKGVAVIPFRIEDVLPSGAMEYYLDVTHWLDALNGPLDQHLETLAKDIDRLLKGTEAEQELPLPRRRLNKFKSELVSNRNRLLWIGGIAAALTIALLMAVWVMRRAPQPGENWFVILGTFAAEDTDGANRRLEQVKAKKFDARIVKTSDFSNFTPNKQAVVMGPYSENMARRWGQKAAEALGIIPTVKPGW
jgi:hypothetical protein